MEKWVKAIVAEELPNGVAKELLLEDRMVALCRVGDAFYALDGICPHQGGPIGKGTLRGCVITCPWHGWQFDVTSGQHKFAQSVKQPTFATKVEEGHVWVNLGDA